MFKDMFGGLKLPGMGKAHHEKSQSTGYNLGMNKGTFATAFDHREYFEQNIRPENKRKFEQGIQRTRNERNSATFIMHD